MRVGLNAGFGHPLAGEFAGMADHGFAVIRQDVFAQADLDVVAALVREFAGAPCRALFLIGGGHMTFPDGSPLTADALAAITFAVVTTATAVGLTDYALEIGNEPDIACPFYADDPAAFAAAVFACYGVASGAGFRGPVITGGIANLNNRGLRYLRRLLEDLPWPDDDQLVVGMHRYPEAGRGPWAPHDQFESRADEWRALRAIIGTRPVACTEFGYHTAPDQDPITLTDGDVAAAVLWDLDFYARAGACLACVYQLNDGPTDQAIDRYGVRYLDGAWKPVADGVKAFYGISSL